MMTKASGSLLLTTLIKWQFNIMTEYPDASVAAFLRRYVPILAKAPQLGGEWVSYPPGERVMHQDGFHSIKVERHPYLEAKHIGARLDVFTQEWQEKEPGFKDVLVWFFFEGKADAEAAFAEISMSFKEIGSSMIADKQVGRCRTVMFADSKVDWHKVALELTPFREGRVKYRIRCSFGADAPSLW